MYVLYGSSFSRFSQQGAIEYNQSITQPAIKLSIEKQLLHIATFLEKFCLQTITPLSGRGVLYHKKQYQLKKIEFSMICLMPFLFVLSLKSIFAPSFGQHMQNRHLSRFFDCIQGIQHKCNLKVVFVSLTKVKHCVVYHSTNSTYQYYGKWHCA